MHCYYHMSNSFFLFLFFLLLLFSFHIQNKTRILTTCQILIIVSWSSQANFLISKKRNWHIPLLRVGEIWRKWSWMNRQGKNKVLTEALSAGRACKATFWPLFSSFIPVVVTLTSFQCRWHQNDETESVVVFLVSSYALNFKLVTIL